MKKNYYLYFILILCYSCQPSRIYRESFQKTNYCFSLDNNNLDTIINFNGYYSFTELYTTNETDPKNKYGRLLNETYVDTITWNSLFFKNGIFLYDFNPKYFNSFIENKNGFYKRPGLLWGKYIISNDTLKCQLIESPRGMSWSKGEVWFEIINNNEIKFLYFKWRQSILEKDILDYQSGKNKRNISNGKFIQDSNLPNPERSWLMKEKWFWCNEKEYEKFMKQQKNK